jgi:rare lipoprotein A
MAAWFLHYLGIPVDVQVAAMMSINLVSVQPRREPPELVIAAESGGAARVGRAVGCGVLLSSMLAVCAPGAVQADEIRASPVKPVPRGEVPSSRPQTYEVLGKRYVVRSSSDGYRERGTASWYGRPFDGRPTSSGEMYDMMELTAAHPTLPIPTWVEVTNLKNGKRVVVKVNDRGPFVGKRLIDLSYGAATALDMVRDGTAHVDVRALPGPPREKTPASRDNRNQISTQASERRDAQEQPTAPVLQPKTPASQPKAPASPATPRSGSPSRPAERQSAPFDAQRLFAEAGRFTTRADAVQLVDSLKAEGFLNVFVVTEDGRRKSLHRVRVGPLTDAAAVEDMNDRLRELGAKRSHTVAMR